MSAARPASAIVISGTGLWGAATPVTTYSAPDDSFAFSLDLPNPTDSNPSGLITNFTYDLNGIDVASVSDAPVITFYSAAQGGLFDLFFETSGDDVSFAGPQIGSDAGGTDTGGGPITISNGASASTSTVAFGTAPTGSGTVVVPEPASLTLLSAGLLALRLRRRARGKAQA